MGAVAVRWLWLAVFCQSEPTGHPTRTVRCTAAGKADARSPFAERAKPRVPQARSRCSSAQIPLSPRLNLHDPRASLRTAIETWPIAKLQPYAKNAKTHGADQVARIAASMAEFGWTVPCPAVQALERSAVRREAARCGRALSRPAGARHRALGRREEPDPGARPDPARPADKEGPRRHDDPRLQAARHDDAFRRAERARRHRHRPEHATAPPPGVHPLPQHRRGCGPEGQAGPRHPR